MLCELVKVLDKLVKVLHVNDDEVFPLSFCIIQIKCPHPAARSCLAQAERQCMADGKGKGEEGK